MTPVRTLVFSSLLVLSAGCKGKPKHQQAPAHVETATGSGSAVASAGSGSAGSGSDSTSLQLPHSDGTPPKKTTKPIDTPTLANLAQMTFPGFLWNPRGNDKTITVEQETASRPKIKARITIAACNNDCVPMDLAKWKAKTEDLKQFLAPELKKAPDTVFEVGQTDLNGQPMIYTYQLGQAFDSGGHGSYTNAYVLYYNDGVNQIRVMASYTDDPMKTKEDMAKWVPKEDLEKVAKAFVDVYTHAWAS